MKVSLNWLKEYLDLSVSTEELSNTFPLLGLDVESIEYKGLKPLDNIVVGEIISQEKHPDADKLSVCQVQFSNDEPPAQIVCGAKNFVVGDRVPVALPGARLPGDFKIKKSKLRGVPSNGMMCSAKELGLSEENEGLLLLKDKPEIGTSINEVFTDTDTIYNLEITSNRGDCLSHIGIARELAAYYNLKVKTPELSVSTDQSNSATPERLLSNLEIQTTECPHYTAWSIKGVSVKESPDWLKKAIDSIGLRPINNIVDITNFVLMECGQPLHAFDAAKIEGQEIIVRNAIKGEKITTLDEKQRTLSPEMLVIADTKKALVIAGVMGSLDAEVTDKTTDILLESAWFKPGSIRATSRKLNLSTDSSYRFARDVDPKGVEWAAKRAIGLILELAGGEISGPEISIGDINTADANISISPAFIEKKLGFAVNETVIHEIFERLGFTVIQSSENWSVKVPSFRREVTRPIDLVEEFIRIYGTDKIPNKRVQNSAVDRNDDPIATFFSNTANYLIGQNFCECQNYTLRSKDETSQSIGEANESTLALSNPITSDQTHIRSSIIPGLLDNIKYNINNGNNVSRLFETGRIFRPSPDGIIESLAVGIVVLKNSLVKNWLERTDVDYYTVKNIISEVTDIANFNTQSLAFEKCTDKDLLWQSNQSAVAGELALKQIQINVGLLNLKTTKIWGIQSPVFAAELIFDANILRRKTKPLSFKAISHFPASNKDLAIVASKNESAEKVRKSVEKIAKKATGGNFQIEFTRIFDVYEGKGLADDEKSIALSISFRSHDRTLKEKEVNMAFDQIQRSIASDTNYKLRS